MRNLVILAAVMIGTAVVFAGKPQKWADVPKPVRDTILANGGVDGNEVDRESGTTKEGKAIYEAPVKSKDGKVRDLVIAEDGKLVETKTDDEADAAAERAQRAKKVLDGVKFSHPTQITHPYLPLASLKQDVLEGTEEGKKVRIERTLRPDLHKTFKIGDQTVETLAFEDRETVDGELEEVAIDYFAQDDAGNVYYLGEEVDEYKKGKVVGHDGSWMYGKDTAVPGVLLPGDLKVGVKFRSEDVSAEIMELDEVVSVSETVIAPAGTYKDCVKVKEKLADGKTEYKYYAKGVGVVREAPAEGDVLLKTHTTR